MDKQLQQIVTDFSLLKQKVEVLNADRPRMRGDSAARRSEIVASLMPAVRAQQSVEVTAAPTAADFNALVTDMRTLFGAIEQLVKRVQ